MFSSSSSSSESELEIDDELPCIISSYLMTADNGILVDVHEIYKWDESDRFVADIVISKKGDDREIAERDSARCLQVLNIKKGKDKFEITSLNKIDIPRGERLHKIDSSYLAYARNDTFKLYFYQLGRLVSSSDPMRTISFERPSEFNYCSLDIHPILNSNSFIVVKNVDNVGTHLFDVILYQIDGQSVKEIDMLVDSKQENPLQMRQHPSITKKGQVITLPPNPKTQDHYVYDPKLRYGVRVSHPSLYNEKDEIFAGLVEKAFARGEAMRREIKSIEVGEKALDIIMGYAASDISFFSHGESKSVPAASSSLSSVPSLSSA